jgi:hypothetical protein
MENRLCSRVGTLPSKRTAAPDKMTAFSRLSRYGMTYKPLTEDRGEELLMSYLAAFHAKTSPQPEKEQGLTESGQGCGEKWHGSFVKYDPDSFLWRTHQCSLLGDLESYSETWPRWGLMRDGECWEQPMLAHRTSETESGLWPTPTVFDSIAENMMPKNGKDTTRLDKFGKARKVLRDGRTASMGLARLVAHNAAIVTNSLLSTDATLLTSVIAHDAKVTANAIWPTPRATKTGKQFHQAEN